MSHCPPPSGSETPPSSSTGPCPCPRTWVLRRQGMQPQLCHILVRDLGHTLPLPRSRFSSLHNEHDPCLLGSDVQVTPEAARQREKRRSQALGRPRRPGSPAARVGGRRPGRPEARSARGRSSPCAGLVPGRMKGPRLGPFEGTPSHPGGQLETTCCSLEPITKARAASVYLSLYFNSSSAFLAGEKNADQFNVKLNSFGQP